MFVDASALCAILLREADADDLYVRLRASKSSKVSAMVVWESAVVLSRRLDIEPSAAKALVGTLLDQTNTEIVAVRPELADLAVDAFERYGKGRHPAGLNFGDCFAYACARHLGVPLLFKGEDFRRTDIEAAAAID